MRGSDAEFVSGWSTLLDLTRRAAARRMARSEPVTLARRSPLVEWVTNGHFTADREPVDFGTWRYLRPLYEAVPADPAGFDLVIMKSAQGGASTLALLFTLWLMLRRRCQITYFLPTAPLAATFSKNRFLKLTRDNHAIHRLMGDPRSPVAARVVDEGAASARRILDSIAYFTHIDGKVTTEALPLDALVFDEVQEMLLGDIERAEERLSASPIGAILRLSTANFAGGDIHYFYERSDQHEFHTRCACPDGIVLADSWDPTSGPLCIDKGNGTTPAVPQDWFYVCPRCKTIISDTQAGEFRPHNPGAARTGFHFPQMLSPRSTPARVLEKWERRVDTKNFYNRVLGRPFSDPSTQPITEAHLAAAQRSDLRWGRAELRAGDGVFMGIDQMGHENYIVIKARIGGRMRLLHLEVVQAADPWRRCADLIREYRVRFVVVEALPNFNEAHRFARAHDGRVFLAKYRDLADEVVEWGDRTRDRSAVWQSDDSIRTPYTVTVDQYRMMSWSLAKWTDGEVETPDARGLLQQMRTPRGTTQVMVCRDLLWLHLQRVALVTESSEPDERRPRRAVRKIGIDPHFAFANMLCDVAWVRSYGRDKMLFLDTPPVSTRRGRPLNPVARQLYAVFPFMFDGDENKLTCGECGYFNATDRQCTLRRLGTAPESPACDDFTVHPMLDDDDYDYD